MATLLVCGDPHGDFKSIFRAAARCRPAAVIVLGDLQPRQSLEAAVALLSGRTEFWFIHGNHDTDSDGDFDRLFGSALAHRNLHGRVVENAGLRIAGLGGIFRSEVWRPPQPPQYESAKAYLAALPARHRWRADLTRKHRSTIFPAEVAALHGYHHDCLDYRRDWPRLGFEAYGVGYRGVADIDGQSI